ncbi:MAG: hypothetical protein JJU03_13425 [Idiomarina sp.]|nr:hypothetical protein [Idiomarina sp.]
MANILDAFYFTILVAGIGLGIAYLIMAFCPVTVPESRGRRMEGVYENVFLGVSGIIIGLLMWVALVF